MRSLQMLLGLPCVILAGCGAAPGMAESAASAVPPGPPFRPGEPVPVLLLMGKCYVYGTAGRTCVDNPRFARWLNEHGAPAKLAALRDTRSVTDCLALATGKRYFERDQLQIRDMAYLLLREQAGLYGFGGRNTRAEKDALIAQMIREIERGTNRDE